MTPRVVISSTVHSVHGGKHHAESIIPGVPICGAPLRNWTRAVAVDERGLCGSCWPTIPVAQTFDTGLENARMAGKTKATPAVFAHCDSGALPTKKESTDG